MQKEGKPYKDGNRNWNNAAVASGILRISTNDWKLGERHGIGASVYFITESPVAQWYRICLPMQETRVRSLSWEDSWRRKWQPAPVVLPGKSHGQRSLVGYSPWGLQRVRHDLATKQQQPQSL